MDSKHSLEEQRWVALKWELPESAVSSCVWLTNGEQAAVRPQVEATYLCKSLAVLRVELHRNRVATLGKVRAELRRRSEQNAATRAQLEANPRFAEQHP